MIRDLKQFVDDNPDISTITHPKHCNLDLKQAITSNIYVGSRNADKDAVLRKQKIKKMIK